MSNINLLPWREALSQRKKKQFGLVLAICLGVTASLGLLANWLVMKQVEIQQARNQRIQTEIGLLDIQLAEIAKLKEERQALIARMKLIEGLQERRNLPVRVFDQLPGMVPNGIYLASLQLQGAKIDVTGKTEAYGRVANMMRRIDGSGWLGQSQMNSIFATDSGPVALSQFSLLFMVQGGQAMTGAPQ